jgi:ComF family protein
VCPECRERELAFGAAAAAFTYEGSARALVTACKFRALRSLADEMARLAEPAFAAAQAGPSPASPPELLVTWVPGHREHALERGFNQAELLARGLARRAGVPYAPLLRRVRHGARQSGLDRTARAANVRDAFALREGVNGVLRKLKRVVIIDDVYTTGETLNHCAKALAGADFRSQVFTFARTVRAHSSQASLAHTVQKERCR